MNGMMAMAAMASLGPRARPVSSDLGPASIKKNEKCNGTMAIWGYDTIRYRE